MGITVELYIRLGTSPGPWQVLVGILVGILVGNVTHGSGSPADTGPRGSGCGFGGGRYPPRVPVHPPVFLLFRTIKHFDIEAELKKRVACGVLRSERGSGV